MILRIDHVLNTQDELERLVSYAIRHGYQRTDPRKGWTQDERKDAARYAAEHMLKQYTGEQVRIY